MNGTTETTSICRDEDCPRCGWPETYYEVDSHDIFAVAFIGCRKCGWRSTHLGAAKVEEDDNRPNIPRSILGDGYTAKLEAARRGHCAAGEPRCICGYQAGNHADLDEHILSAAVGNEPDRRRDPRHQRPVPRRGPLRLRLLANGGHNMTIDPLGLTRCASCENAFEHDRRPDGTCGHCGGPFDAEAARAQCESCGLTYLVDEDDEPVTQNPYTCDDCGGAVETVE
jgi:hypothetical protein